MPILRGSGVGSLLGARPGTGPSTSTFLAYGWEKQIAKQPERFGNGAIEGIAAPESANNAAVQTAFIPTMTLGIPATPTMALLLAAIMIHGLTPGTQLMTERPDPFWGLISSYWIGHLLLLVHNIPPPRPCVTLLNHP